MAKRKFRHYDGEPDHKADRRRRRDDKKRRKRRPAGTATEQLAPPDVAPISDIDAEALLAQCETEFARGLISELLEAGITPSPRLFDQHFLVDPDMINAVVNAAQIQEGDNVLEIGPGPGNLTGPLWEACSEVRAGLSTIELDTRFARMLNRFPAELKRYWGDAIAEFNRVVRSGKINKVVGNIPYKILEPLLIALHTNRSIQKAVLLVGGSYADRVCASAKDEGSFFSTTSLFSQARFTPNVTAEIPRESFIPEPRTKSAIVTLDAKERGEIDIVFATIARNIARHPNMPTRQVIQNMLGGLSGPKRVKGRKAEDVMQGRVSRMENLGLSRDVLARPISQLNNNELRVLVNRLDLAKKRRRNETRD